MVCWNDLNMKVEKKNGWKLVGLTVQILNHDSAIIMKQVCFNQVKFAVAPFI